jgi:hypothetical protein
MGGLAKTSSELIRTSGRVVWKTNSEWGTVMGVVHVLCKVVNEVMCCCCAVASMPARKVVHPEKHGGVSYTPLSNLTSPYPPHSLPPSLPHLSDLTHSPAPHPPSPPSLLTSFSPPTPEFWKMVGWFENLIASIRIKIRIYKNSPVVIISRILGVNFGRNARTLLCRIQ